MTTAQDIEFEFTKRYKAELTNLMGSTGWRVWDYDTNMVANDENGTPIYRRTRYECEKWMLANEEA